MKIYCIYDTEENKFWNRGAKVAWAKSGYAKSALIQTISGVKQFDDQSRFVVKEIDLNSYLEIQEVEAMFNEINFELANLEEQLTYILGASNG